MTVQDGSAVCEKALRGTAKFHAIPHGRYESLCHLETYRYTASNKEDTEMQNTRGKSDFRRRSVDFPCALARGTENFR